MKKRPLLFAILCLLLSGCTAVDSPLEDLSPKNYIPTSISESEAMSIADKAVGITRTGDQECQANFMYILRKQPVTKASVALPDTLAYIINYSNERGFAIVSADKRISPLLAYSAEDSFSLTNEVCKANFIDNIEAYMESCVLSDTKDENESEVLPTCYRIDPTVVTKLKQGSPFDKYVIQEHPGCPVGCVAVAVATIMTHANSGFFTYHGTTYNFLALRNALANGPTINDPNVHRIVGGPTSYTYDQAVDAYAKILYWIGKDVNMDYSPSGSAAYSFRAFNLFRDLNYTFSTSQMSLYNLDAICIALRDGHIVYVEGVDNVSNPSKPVGHAWVIDGATYCVDALDDTIIKNVMLRCEWGWGGTGNGYYNGDVFNVGSYNFSGNYYFAVKIM